MHLLKPDNHTEDLGLQTLQGASQAGPVHRAWPHHPKWKGRVPNTGTVVAAAWGPAQEGSEE